MNTQLSTENRMKLVEWGRACKRFREYKGYTRSQVSDEIGQSIQNIQRFEDGMNNSAIILMWYIKAGLQL